MSRNVNLETQRPGQKPDITHTEMSNIINVDRSKIFDITSFACLDRDWNKPEEDDRSLALTQIDLDRVKLLSMLNEGEKSISSEERLKRLVNAGHIRLDALVLQTLLREDWRIPNSWKVTRHIVNLLDHTRPHIIHDVTSIFFDGTILSRPNSEHKSVLCLQWDYSYDYGKPIWGFGMPSMEYNRPQTLSAVYIP